ncbi:unnamed protein product [Discula destructiva]
MYSVVHPPLTNILRGTRPTPDSALFSPARCSILGPQQRRFLHGGNHRLSVLSARNAAHARRLKLAADRLEANGDLSRPRFSAEIVRPERERRRVQQLVESLLDQRAKQTSRLDFQTQTAAAPPETWTASTVASIRNVWSSTTRGIIRALLPDDGPVRWEKTLLFVDVANAVVALRSGYHKGPEFALRELARLPALRGCQVFAMVEGSDRQLKAPTGIKMIRAPPIMKKNIGDDALVDYIWQILSHGVDASRLVLVTEDKRLMQRMPYRAQKRSPQWLRAELVALDELERTRAEATLAHAAVEKAGRADLAKESAPSQPKLEDSRVISWREAWMASLRSLLGPGARSGGRPWW